MHQYVFAARNVLDKLKKIAGGTSSAQFYLRTYVLSRFDRVTPDVYLVSYPKCGRTWVRVFMLEYSKLLGRPSRSFNDRGLITCGDKIVKFEHGQGNWVPAPPRLSRMEFRRERYRDRRVVFLVRDPRDVLVSSFYHLKFRENIYTESLSTFVRDELVGAPKVVSFMNMWLEHQGEVGAFMMSSYEELHGAPEKAFSEMLSFMGIEVDQEKVLAAIDNASFDNMKKMETHGAMKEPWMQPGAKNLDKALKVRKGKIGGYRDEMTVGDMRYVNDVIAQRLDRRLPYL